ncbi:MAG: DUF262 domain-containing protein [Symbiobacteriaceae bacterium]|nr:DUF262 domain-containing protein [Symbiobacteriaceae bacterium]
MIVSLHEITIREVIESYVDNAEEGVIGYGGLLNIRPKYQREFVYNDAQQRAVMETIFKGFPLNVMYWAVNNDNLEVLDGQQRTISFCRYVQGDYMVENRYFGNLTERERQQVLDYKLMVYFCEGDDRDKLDWFRVVNIAGLKLTDQELRNAVYTGSWLTHAKSIFSRSNCAAANLSSRYVRATPNRQELLEVALSWLSGDEIEAYMAKHQHDPNANELWTYFHNVIQWVDLTFPVYRSEMRNLPWHTLYQEHGKRLLDTAALETKVQSLMQDEDVTNKKGIYAYVLGGDERSLNIRRFSDGQKREAYERQSGVCSLCGDFCDFGVMEADHITPWSKGGRTVPDNCQLLCRDCNRRKGNV